MIKIYKKIKGAPLALKASIAYTLCSIIQKSIGFITMPLFTSLLTTEQYGQYTIYASWSSIFMILITLNLAYGSFGHAMIKYEGKREEYVSSIQSLVFLFALAFVGIYLPFSSFFNSFLELPTSVMLLMAGEILFTFGFQCWLGIQRYKFKYWPAVIMTILVSTLCPILAFILIKNMDEKGVARIIGFAAINIFFGLLIFVYNLIKGKKLFSKEYWGFALKFNLPLLAYYFSQVIFNQSDRIMIQKLCDDGLSKAAVYGVGYTIALILTFVLTAINNAYIPWLYGKIRDKDIYKNRSMSIIITIIMCTLIGGVIWITPELVKLMAGKAYIEAIWVIPPVSISLILLLFTQFSTNIEFYYAEKYKLIIASIGAAALNIGLNFWLIPIYGYLVAGYTTLASYVVFAVGNYFAIFKHLKKGGELHGLYNVPVLLIIFALFVGLSYLGVFLYNYPIARYVSIGVVIILLLIFSKKIYIFCKKLTSKDMMKVVKEEQVENEASLEEAPLEQLAVGEENE